MKIKNKAVLGRSALICTTFIWGTSFVVLKSALDSITPLWVLAIRFGGAALMMLVASIPLLKKLDKQYLKGGAIMGACLAAAYTVQTYGLMYTTPGKNAFLTATYCILVPFLYWIIFDKKPDKYNIGAALICLVGMGFVCLNKDLSVNKGDLLTVCCGLFYGLHIIVTSRHVEGKSPLLLTMIQFAVAAILCLAFALMFEPKPRKHTLGLVALDSVSDIHVHRCVLFPANCRTEVHTPVCGCRNHDARVRFRHGALRCHGAGDDDLQYRSRLRADILCDPDFRN